MRINLSSQAWSHLAPLILWQSALNSLVIFPHTLTIISTFPFPSPQLHSHRAVRVNLWHFKVCWIIPQNLTYYYYFLKQHNLISLDMEKTLVLKVLKPIVKGLNVILISRHSHTHKTILHVSTFWPWLCGLRLYFTVEHLMNAGRFVSKDRLSAQSYEMACAFWLLYDK